MIKPLKTLRYHDRLALEYEIVEPVVDGYQPHHPQTFPPMGAVTLPDVLRDDRCTWDNLRRLCTPPRTTDDDCVARAWELLQKEIDGSQDTATTDFDLKLARATLGIEE